MILEVHDSDIEARDGVALATISARQPGADPRETRPDVVETSRWPHESDWNSGHLEHFGR
jgi:hypothetical protein